MDKENIMSAMNYQLDDNLNLNIQTTGNSTFDGTSLTGNLGQTPFSYPISGWTYWSDYYYPQIIRESYPVYIQERAIDKGRQAFEIIKMLNDKRLVRLDKVSDFIDVMDALIKIL